MSSVLDVARYILQEKGSMSAMKLQKLVYYSQAWSLVWDDAALFDSKIEAWANGPVIPALYYRHRGEFVVSEDMIKEGDANNLKSNQIEAIDLVLGYYYPKNAQELSDLTHSEDPWQKARKNVADGERCEEEIKLADMSMYYSSLQ